MKTVILCGGLGTRLSEETVVKPKPMVHIGGLPILWHIMKIYAHFNENDFVLALGYKAEIIKEYFLNFYTLNSDFKVNLKVGKIELIKEHYLDWDISLIDTGLASLTGGRLHRLESFLKPTGTFMLTYGDGVADVNIKELLAFHKKHGKIATVTAVRPPSRFGAIKVNGDNLVDTFAEKPQMGEGWINGGFFVFEPEIFNYVSSDDTILEREPLEQLAQDNQLMAFKHDGSWQCMDTIRDREFLEQLWQSDNAFWKCWT